MKILLSITLLLGFSVPAIAHNEANGGDALHNTIIHLRKGNGGNRRPNEVEEGQEGPNRENIDAMGEGAEPDFHRSGIFNNTVN